MRSTLLLLAALGLAAHGTAQIGLNRWSLHPGPSTLTDRGGLPNQAGGDLLTKVDSRLIQFIGNACNPGATGRINGFRVLLLDENGRTPDGFTFVICPDDPANPGNPDPTPGTELFRSAAQQSPLVPAIPAGQSPRRQFLRNFTMATPFEDVTLTQSDWYFGVGFEPMSEGTWPTDGLSIPYASYYEQFVTPTQTSPPTHDNPRINAPQFAYRVIPGSVGEPVVQAFQPTSERTHDMRILTDRPVLSVGQDVIAAARTTPANGNPNPMFGVGGMFPDTSGNRGGASYQQRGGPGNGDGAAFRVRDALNEGGLAFILFSTGFASFSLKTPIAEGSFPANPLFFNALPGASGSLTFNGGQVQSLIQPGYLAQGSISPGLRGRLVFFGLTADQNLANLKWTNAQTIIFR